MTETSLEQLPTQLLTDLKDVVEQELAHAKKNGAMDFASVVALAHERAPEQIGEQALARALELDCRQADLDEQYIQSDAGEAELNFLLAEARSVVEAETASSRHRVPPSLPATPIAIPRKRAWAFGTLAVAALLLGVVSIGSSSLAVREYANVAVQAFSGSTVAEPQASERKRPRQRSGPPSAVNLTGSGDAENNEFSVETGVDEASATSTESPKPTKNVEAEEPKVHAPTPKRRRYSLAEKLTTLDADAQRALTNGEFKRAKKLYEKITRLGKNTRYADLAFGDLFSLARQRSDTALESRLWKRYLADFPRGRYADDARAGLCRRTQQPNKAACWNMYLRDFPNGVYHRTAARFADE